MGSAWHVATTNIIAPYKAFSIEKLPAKIGANIGLMHVNITLAGKLVKLTNLYIQSFQNLNRKINAKRESNLKNRNYLISLVLVYANIYY